MHPKQTMASKSMLDQVGDRDAADSTAVVSGPDESWQAHGFATALLFQHSVASVSMAGKDEEVLRPADQLVLIWALLCRCKQNFGFCFPNLLCLIASAAG